MYIERLGTGGSTIVLLHGSMAPGWESWSAQRELARHFRLVVPHRIGYPPNPPQTVIDFEDEAPKVAELIQPGWHLIGHSYGAVVALLAAAVAGERLASLTVIEPPVFNVARGHPAADHAIAELAPIFEHPNQSVRDFTVRFVAAVGGSEPLPDPLPAELEASARAAMAERRPWEASIPFDALRGANLPVLVVSGGHSPAFDAVCDVLERELHADRAVIPGAGHGVQWTGDPFNQRVREFIRSTDAR